MRSLEQANYTLGTLPVHLRDAFYDSFEQDDVYSLSYTWNYSMHPEYPERIARRPENLGKFTFAAQYCMKLAGISLADNTKEVQVSVERGLAINGSKWQNTDALAEVVVNDTYGLKHKTQDTEETSKPWEIILLNNTQYRVKQPQDGDINTLLSVKLIDVDQF